MGAGAEFTGVADWFPSKQVSVDYGQSSKAGKARITLDFNLKDFKTLAGIARMNTVNSMEVYKAVKQKEVGITLFGPTFGAKGSVKKVQGRHEAVRLLVQVSMIQMAGKYLALPYWRLLGEDALPDEIVLDQLARDFACMNESQRIAKVQELLFLHGCDVYPNGVLDDQTKKALQLCDSTLKSGSIKIDRDTFVNLYLSTPITDNALARRHQFASLISGGKAVVAGSAVAPSEMDALTRAPAEEQTEGNVSRREKGSVGRMLADDEW